MVVGGMVVGAGMDALPGPRPEAAGAALLERYLIWQQQVDAAVAAKDASPAQQADQTDLQVGGGVCVGWVGWGVCVLGAGGIWGMHRHYLSRRCLSTHCVRVSLSTHTHLHTVCTVATPR